MAGKELAVEAAAEMTGVASGVLLLAVLLVAGADAAADGVTLGGLLPLDWSTDVTWLVEAATTAAVALDAGAVELAALEATAGAADAAASSVPCAVAVLSVATVLVLATLMVPLPLPEEALFSLVLAAGISSLDLAAFLLDIGFCFVLPGALRWMGLVSTAPETSEKGTKPGATAGAGCIAAGRLPGVKLALGLLVG